MRVVCVSDTHLTTPELPLGDLLVHAGDLCRVGTEREFIEGIKWIAAQPHAEKIYVPGNHDRYVFDYPDTADWWCRKYNIYFLKDSGITISGIRFYGCPWTRTFGWTKAFMTDEDVLDAIYGRMPKCDFLITHGPPAGIFDNVDGIPVGSPGLVSYIERVKPAVHVFGHIHIHHGMTMRFNHLDGKQTLFANICALNGAQMPVKDPVLQLEIEKYGTAIHVADRR